MKKILMIIILMIVLISSGCQKKQISSNNKEFITVNSIQDVIINIDEITEKATYYNYEIEGVTIQLFAVKASDNSIRVAFNTCGSCNPDKNSYFIQKGRYFECQTCGNKFEIDEIGLDGLIGCSPIPITGNNKIYSDNTIKISKEYLSKYKSKFENINIYS